MIRLIDAAADIVPAHEDACLETTGAAYKAPHDRGAQTAVSLPVGAPTPEPQSPPPGDLARAPWSHGGRQGGRGRGPLRRVVGAMSLAGR